MPDGSFPMGSVPYLKKAIKAVGRAPAGKRPALRRLIRKRARALHATGAKGVAGTRAMSMSGTGQGLELSTTATRPRHRELVDPRNVSVHRSGNITTGTGMKLGTIKAANGMYRATHTDGHETEPSRTAAIAVARLAAYHNAEAQRRPGSPPGPGNGSAATQGPLSFSVPAAAAGDGPRMTVAGGLGPVGKRAYSKLCAKGVPPKRARKMAAKAESMVMKGRPS